MFERFFPDEYVVSTYVIPFERLYEEGYRGVIFDIDNTLVPHGAPADDRAKKLFRRLKEIGFSSCLISNNQEERVKMFNQEIRTNYIYNAHKPSTKNYEKAMKIMGTDKTNTFFVGDQLFTDVWGAKRTGIHNILVRPINPKEEIQIVLKRYLEKIVLHFYKKRLKNERGDFKNGSTVEIDGNIYQILEFQHVKPGKGAAFVRTKLKNIISGGAVERTFRPTEKFPKAHIDRKDMQYLYQDGDLYNFMDVETYDQIALNADVVGDALKFVKENETVKICSHNGNVFSVEPPLFVELEITETEPGFKGDTAQGATKPAVVETGATVMVPLFVEQGDVLKIDTRTGEYLSRV